MQDLNSQYQGPIITRKQAKELGLKYYFTGKPCNRGHTSQRLCTNRSCLDCSRLWPKSNPEKWDASQKKYKKTNAEKIKKYRKSHYEKNKEHCSAWGRKYYEKHRLQINIKHKEWKKKNKASVKACTHNRRATKRNAGGKHTKTDIENLISLQNHKCNNCSCCLHKSNYHVDHIIPLSRGGSNGKENLQILCPHCNLCKGDKLPTEWERIRYSVSLTAQFNFTRLSQ